MTKKIFTDGHFSFVPLFFFFFFIQEKKTEKTLTSCSNAYFCPYFPPPFPALARHRRGSFLPRKWALFSLLLLINFLFLLLLRLFPPPSPFLYNLSCLLSFFGSPSFSPFLCTPPCALPFFDPLLSYSCSSCFYLSSPL